MRKKITEYGLDWKICAFLARQQQKIKTNGNYSTTNNKVRECTERPGKGGLVQNKTKRANNCVREREGGREGQQREASDSVRTTDTVRVITTKIEFKGGSDHHSLAFILTINTHNSNSRVPSSGRYDPVNFSRKLEKKQGSFILQRIDGSSPREECTMISVSEQLFDNILDQIHSDKEGEFIFDCSFFCGWLEIIAVYDLYYDDDGASSEQWNNERVSISCVDIVVKLTDLFVCLIVCLTCSGTSAVVLSIYWILLQSPR